MSGLEKSGIGIYGISTATGEIIPIDVDVSGSIVTISHEHSKVHQGAFYSVGYFADAVVDNGVIEMSFETPSDLTAHMYIKVSAGGDCMFSAYEDLVTSADGTSVTAVNHNRASTNTCSCTVFHTPTITADGTLLWLEYIPGGTGVGAGGASVTPGAVQGVSTEQVILATGTKYLFRLQNVSGVAEPLQITLAYYGVPG